MGDVSTGTDHEEKCRDLEEIIFRARGRNVLPWLKAYQMEKIRAQNTVCDISDFRISVNSGGARLDRKR